MEQVNVPPVLKEVPELESEVPHGQNDWSSDENTAPFIEKEMATFADGNRKVVGEGSEGSEDGMSMENDQKTVTSLTQLLPKEK